MIVDDCISTPNIRLLLPGNHIAAESAGDEEPGADAGGQRARQDAVGGRPHRAPPNPAQEQTTRQISKYRIDQ